MKYILITFVFIVFIGCNFVEVNIRDDVSSQGGQSNEKKIEKKEERIESNSLSVHIPLI